MLRILRKLFPWLNRAERREQEAMRAYLRRLDEIDRDQAWARDEYEKAYRKAGSL